MGLMTLKENTHETIQNLTLTYPVTAHRQFTFRFGRLRFNTFPTGTKTAGSPKHARNHTTEQQAQLDKELALKAEAMANYTPVDEPLNPYFIETAKKLNVNIEGLSDSDIMIKVKEAEVQYAIDHPVILTPQQQAEFDRLTALKLTQAQ